MEQLRQRGGSSQACWHTSRKMAAAERQHQALHASAPPTRHLQALHSGDAGVTAALLGGSALGL